MLRPYSLGAEMLPTIVISERTYAELQQDHYVSVTISKKHSYKEGECVYAEGAYGIFKALITDIYIDDNVQHLTLEKVWEYIT